jgi:hypothetical protein
MGLAKRSEVISMDSYLDQYVIQSSGARGAVAVNYDSEDLDSILSIARKCHEDGFDAVGDNRVVAFDFESVKDRKSFKNSIQGAISRRRENGENDPKTAAALNGVALRWIQVEKQHENGRRTPSLVVRIDPRVERVEQNDENDAEDNASQAA